MLTRLLAYLDGRRGRVIDLQRELTSRPAVGPDNNGPGEADRADWLELEMMRAGLGRIRRHDCPDPRCPSGFRPNISARVQGKRDQTLRLIAHLDIVPPGDEALWQHPPHVLRVEGDYVYGRGVEDNQQAVVTALLAAEALIACGVTPDLSLGLLFVADEETGMSRGLPHVLDCAPELFGPRDLFLVPDIGNSAGDMVETAEKSRLWLKVTVNGKQCHAAAPQNGVNSLRAAAACIQAMDGLESAFPGFDPLFSPPCSTFVPTKKEANVENINTLPGKDVFYLDCRVLPDRGLAEVEAKVRALAQEATGRYGATAEVERICGEQATAATPADAPVVRRLLDALRRHRGIEGKLCGTGGQTLTLCLRRRGLHAAAWATLPSNAHAPDEKSDIRATIADAGTVLTMLFDT
ncbi:MAG: M20 family metallo-hydrolase [Desulfovibrio sp.]|jgi:succinyl-diaminopimelate desuccinylase|nr:M20 family metallo-hydrolase [Desulfovibrio sp.]